MVIALLVDVLYLAIGVVVARVVYAGILRSAPYADERPDAVDAVAGLFVAFVWPLVVVGWIVVLVGRLILHGVQR